MGGAHGHVGKGRASPRQAVTSQLVRARLSCYIGSYSSAFNSEFVDSRSAVRILQVNSVGIEVGGAERSISLLSDRFRENGHDVRVLCTSRYMDRYPPEEMPSQFATDVIPAIAGPRPWRLAQYTWFPRARAAFRKMVRDFRPEVVHFHTISEFSPAMLWLDAGAPRILTVHGPEEWTGSLLEWNFPGRSRGQLTPFERAHTMYLRFVQGPHYRRNLRRFDLALAPSQFYADAVGDDLPGVPMQIVPNGVELPGPSPLPSSPSALFLGRLEASKGVEHLIAAFHRVVGDFPEVRLRIVGDGTERGRLEAAASAGAAAHAITFTGWCSADEVRAELTRASFVVVPSVWPENFGLVVLEALGSGRPIVASRVGGLPGIIRDGDSGLLVPPGDQTQLADAMRRLLASRVELERLAAGAWRSASDFDVDLHAARLEEIYRDVVVLGSSGRRHRGGWGGPIDPATLWQAIVVPVRRFRSGRLR